VTGIRWSANDHRRIPKNYPEPPTPREIRALKAVQDGSPLTEAAEKLGITAPALGSILSGVYARLLVKDMGGHHLSQDRRAMAIKICKQNGWWET
jgi:DNA-binding NarL/FixJ family response regulator